jgi:hypothetical protein
MTLGDFIKVNDSKVNIVLFFNDVIITQNGVCMSFNELIKYQDYVIDHICFDNCDSYDATSGLQIRIYLADPKPGVLESLAKSITPR